MSEIDHQLNCFGNSRPELFERHPLVEELYTNRFRPALRQQYDSVESYLLDRLDWSRADVGQALATQRYFTRHIEPQFVRVRRNDWPYSVPHNFQCVQSPDLHAMLFLIGRTLEDTGLCGLYCPYWTGTRRLRLSQNMA